MFVTVEIKKPLEVCFHPWQNLFLNCTHDNAYRVISWREIVRDSPTIAFLLENTYFFFNRLAFIHTKILLKYKLTRNLEEVMGIW